MKAGHNVNIFKVRDRYLIHSSCSCAVCVDSDRTKEITVT